MSSSRNPRFRPDADEDETPPLRAGRAPRRGLDVNELPVWTWVAILLIVVVIGVALWLMTRSGGGAGEAPVVSTTPTPTVSSASGTTQPRASAAAPVVGPGTPTPVIMGNTPTPLPPSELAAGVRAVVQGTGADQLRVRSGPGTDYATLGIVPDGTELKVLEGPQAEGTRKWWRVELKDGTVGWTVDGFLKPIGR
jgi:hypothetical protein